MATQNNFGKLKKVMIGTFPDHKLVLPYYEKLGDKRVWKLYEKIATDTQEDLDNLATFYKDHGVTVIRSSFDNFTSHKWKTFAFKPTRNLSNRFLAYKDLILYLSQAEDQELVYFDGVRNCLEQMHDAGKYVICNPVTLETGIMQEYDDSDWPGHQGFGLDAPCFTLAENNILYNRKHCNTDRGIEWVQRVISKFYPDTNFIDVSDHFVNHLDAQIRIYNKNLAHARRSVPFVNDILQKIYPGIKVLDISEYEQCNVDFKREMFSGKEGVWREVEWLKSWIDFDDQNGNIDTANVSVDSKTVVEPINQLDLYKKLESHGLKVERVPLRHSKFWGSGLCCETAVLERESE